MKIVSWPRLITLSQSSRWQDGALNKTSSQAPTSARTSKGAARAGEGGGGAAMRRRKKLSSPADQTQHKGHGRAANMLLLIRQGYGTKGRVNSLVWPAGASLGLVSRVFSTDRFLTLQLPSLWQKNKILRSFKPILNPFTAISRLAVRPI